MTYRLFTRNDCYRCPAVKNFLEASAVNGVTLDAETALDECRMYEINSVPTVVFFGHEGTEIGRTYSLSGAMAFVANRLQGVGR